VADNICCCDLTPHPEDRLTWTGTKAEGNRYQLIKRSCHVDFIEVTVHTSAESDTTTVKFFTTPDPSDTSEDVNLWNLTLAVGEGSQAETPPQFDGIYFRHGLYAEVMSTDTTAEVNINIVYYRRENYTPAIPERPYERRTRLWDCYNDEDSPYGDNFTSGYDADDYGDTSSSSTPGTSTGSPIED